MVHWLWITHLLCDSKICSSRCRSCRMLESVWSLLSPFVLFRSLFCHEVHHKAGVTHSFPVANLGDLIIRLNTCRACSFQSQMFPLICAGIILCHLVPLTCCWIRKRLSLNPDVVICNPWGTDALLAQMPACTLVSGYALPAAPVATMS